ncbi:trimeric intracellular cation channel family protein [Limoniibacter endophyticus]|uniref:trimeric intracellular cation channel family protein n=1 Tax=Limoniibacter endophyticus TaxID=1565040 RepID=UPI00361D5559
MTAFQILDYCGIAVFAATGALAASRKQLDIVGFLFFAVITGIGGGTFRDMLLDIPVFWVVQPVYVLVCIGIALLVYVFAHLLESRYKALLWLDALGLGAYTVVGASKGLIASGEPSIAIVTGVLTAVLGGIIRDMIAGEESVLMRDEVYVTASVAGALAFVLGQPLLPAGMAAYIGFAVGFLVRAGAIRYGWSLPRYKSRPGRKPEDIP